MVRDVNCRWLNGDVTVLESCDVVGHVRAKICELKHCAWHDVCLMSDAYEVLENDSSETAAVVVVVIKPSGCQSTEAIWVRTLVEHFKHGLQDDFNDRMRLENVDPRRVWPKAVEKHHKTGVEESKLMKTVLAFARNGDLESIQTFKEFLQSEDRDMVYILRRLWTSCDTSRSGISSLNTLLRAGLLCYATSAERAKVLIVAVTTANVELVVDLLAARADANQKTVSGDAPLHVAALEGHVAIVETLMAHKADVNAKAAGATPLALCVQGGIKVAGRTNALRFHKILTSLLLHGADPTLCLDSQQTPLHLAGDRYIVETLLIGRANIDAQDSRGATPLHYVTENKHVRKEVFDALIESGADVNAQTNYGWLPLHYAVKTNKKDYVEALVINGSHIDVRSKNGKTPSDCVRNNAQIQELVRAPLSPAKRMQLLESPDVPRKRARLIVNLSDDCDEKTQVDKAPAEVKRHTVKKTPLR